MFCYKCGLPIGEGKKFCPNCGAPQNTADASTQPAQFDTAPQPTFTPANPTAYVNSEFQPTPAYPASAAYPPAPDYSSAAAYPPAPDYSASAAYPPATAYPPVAPYSPAPEYPTVSPYETLNNASFSNNEYTPVYTPPPLNSEYPTSSPSGPTNTPYPQSYPPPGTSTPGYPGFSSEEPATKKGAGKLVKIGIPVVAVLAVAVVAVILIFASSSPITTSYKAISGMVLETGERLEGTPLNALWMLKDTLKDGSLTANFEYKDTWSEEEIGGKVKISTNAEKREGAIEADISINGQNVDAEFYLDKERIAIGSKLIDDNYYGLRYSTIRDDIEPFGILVGLSSDLRDTISSAIEMIGKSINAKTSEEKDIEAFRNVFVEFINKSEPKAGDVKIEADGISIKCKKIEFVFTAEQIVGLLNDLYDLYESNEQIREQFNEMNNNPLLSSEYGSVSYDDMLAKFRNSINDIESKMTGEITYSLFVGSGDRLLRVEMTTNLVLDDNLPQVSAVFDFGAANRERWTFDVTVVENGSASTYKIIWDYSSSSSSIVNTLAINLPDEEDPITLKSVWSTENWKFTLSCEDQWGDVSEITGAFFTTDNTFSLVFDNLFPEDSDTVLTIEIVTEPGAKIKQIDYINIDKWDQSLIEKIAAIPSKLAS